MKILSGRHLTGIVCITTGILIVFRAVYMTITDDSYIIDYFIGLINIAIGLHNLTFDTFDQSE